MMGSSRFRPMKKIVMETMENIETLTRKFAILMHVYLDNSNSLKEFDNPFFKLDNELTDLIHYPHIQKIIKS